MKVMNKKIFCIAGPINPDFHYFIPHRLDWDNLHRLIQNREYFVLHAPRQSGKTTAILEFCRKLNVDGMYNALYINVESAQAVRENVEKGLLMILNDLLYAVKNQWPHEEKIIDFLEKRLEAGFSAINLKAIQNSLEFLAQTSAKPIVLFIDEIDSLIGDTLLAVLRQIRAGFNNRPQAFPHALCLIGLRDVRDYKIWSRLEGKHISTSSPFNIKSESLALSNFSLEDVRDLYAQHTLETGQLFLQEAVEHAYYLSAGQPWLVNALAYQVCYRDLKNSSEPISKDMIDRAKDALIKRRDTHLDSLIDKLREPRVRPIIEAIITGETDLGNIQPDDLQYVRDLGLIKQERLDIASPIYREIIPRELEFVATELITQTVLPYKRADGSLNASALIQGFVDFYREHSAIWLDKFDYKEAAPHLLMMAFLQRVINGGGTLQREYALGTGRVDILLKWDHQTIVIELKIRHKPSSVTEGLKQTASYMDTSLANEGHLIVFDRDPKKSWEEKIFTLTEAVDGKIIHVWGL
jgi:hypothetical protein